MKQVITIFLAGAFLLTIITGCSSPKNNLVPTKLSNKEISKLIDFARDTIKDMKPAKLTKSELDFIIMNQPAHRIIYTGDKIGHVTLKWETGTRIIYYTADGNILDFKASFKKINVITIKTQNKLL